MPIAKKILAALVISRAAFAFAFSQKELKGSACALLAAWNESACPGDAVVARIVARSADRKKTLGDVEASLELFAADKRVDKTKFFYSGGKIRRQNAQEFLAYLPLSTWLGQNDYSLKITVKVDGEADGIFTLPFSLAQKSFVSETIPLDERNTAIKTDESPARVDQINRLNKILGTIDEDGFYGAKPFVPPVAPDTRRSSFYGDRRVYKYASGKSSTAVHWGIDYAVPTGTEVRSCADGKVVMAEERISTGWSVAIEHAPGLYSLYYHMSALNVKEGQTVRQGDKIGLSGATGLATGPHLHWEVRLNMCAVSPDFFTGDYACSSQK